MTRPTFLQGLLDSWQLSVSQHRRRDLIPYWIAGSLVIGGLVAYRLPVTLWESEIELGVVFMGAVLTFNGIVLALSWSAFAKIYEIVGAGAFCAHLRKHNLLNHYLTFVGWCQGSQVLAISCSALGLVSFWLFVPWFGKVVLGCSFAASIYAVRQGVATSKAMQDLIWRKSAFDEARPRDGIQPVEGAA